MERYAKQIRAFLIAVLVAILAFVFYTGQIHWGSLEIAPASTITVTGTGKMDQAPQIATFVTTVSVSDDDKTKATDSVNTKMTDIVNSLKNFGIADSDIQTAQISVYENKGAEVMTYPPRPVDVKKWQASNTITVKLKDTSKASALSDLLTRSGATSVSGPNFAINDTSSSDAELLTKAVEDAKSKAEAAAKAGGRTLGKMITLTEGGNNQIYPTYAAFGKGLDSSVPTPVEPGNQTLTKTVTVIYELR